MDREQPQIPVIDYHRGRKKVCSRCREEKKLTEFSKRGKRPGYHSECKACDYAKAKSKLTSDLRSRLSGTLQNAKTSSKNKNREFALDVDYLIWLWEMQSGKCFYSAVEMTIDGKNKYTTVSLDRIDSSKGYVQDNVVLCCTFVNKMKGDMPIVAFVDWCKKIFEHCGV